MKELFSKFRLFLARQSGIFLEPDRDYMIETRLAPVMRQWKFTSLEALLNLAMNGSNPDLSKVVIEAMLTGETFFFRDRPVFEVFREKILPGIISERQGERKLRIWCAACSSGQEPYSVAMILDEEARALRGWNIEIVATDLSATAIENARAGFYNQFEVQRGLPVAHLLRYFGREQERWRIAEHLRSRVEFRQLNLLSDLTELGAFDVIFCRNVLMYFDTETRRQVLARVADQLEPEGWLFLGATENNSGLGARLQPASDAPSTFRLRPGLTLHARLQKFASARA